MYYGGLLNGVQKILIEYTILLKNLEIELNKNSNLDITYMYIYTRDVIMYLNISTT